MTTPLTILYVSNTRHPWCTEVAVTASLRSLGHVVVNLQEDALDWSTVPDLAAQHDADLLLWTKTWSNSRDVVQPQLDRLREMGVPSVAWHLDLFATLDRRHQIRDEPFFASTDLLVTPHDSEEWPDLGVRHFYSPPGVFDQECTDVPPAPRKYPQDIVFVGSHPYPHAEWEPVRSAVIAAFQAEFGPRFAVWPKNRRPLRGRDLQELYATAKVVLGDSCLVGEPRLYTSDRVPETIGRGGLLIHPYVPGVFDGEQYQTGEHLLTYTAGHPEEAVEHARWALANPEAAQAIRRAGRAHVLDHHTYRNRMRDLVSYLRSSGLLS